MEKEITVEQQAAAAAFMGLIEIAQGDLSDVEARERALAAIKEMQRVQREGEPLHGIETSGRDDGDRMGQPPGVLYTLTITDEGDANEWRSDRVQTAEQVAWLHGIVMAAAEQLSGGVSGSSLN